jgi:site-specific DNA-methyltransferase (adenine-specific)
MNIRNNFYNEDCILGSKLHLKDNSIDLIITDPPYGIQGDKLHKHYNRNEEFVIEGYIEIPKEEYADFSVKWIKEAERTLRPGGSIYIVSGYTNLIDVLNALKHTKLQEVNHIIWKYNFGVYTSQKYVSSHYHILFYQKPGGKRTFNTYCRFGKNEQDEKEGSLNYHDREDVWIINREYKPGITKNKNELPTELLKKIILYSSNEGDLIADFFLGSFSTAKVAIGLNRRATGFEMSTNSFTYQIKELEKVRAGNLMNSLRRPEQTQTTNSGKSWNDTEIKLLLIRYRELMQHEGSKKETIKILTKEFKRGRFGIQKMLEKNAEKSKEAYSLFFQG